ncbi:MAG TPA: hypothetical protein VF763_10090 [Candidatus Limnocylindrales bacterium]
MTSEPRAFFALDLGAATAAASLIGHLDGRWRLLAAGAAPVETPLEPLLEGLAVQVRVTDPEAFAAIAPREDGHELGTAAWPRLVARSTPPSRLAVLAGARRQRGLLERAARRAGWRVSGGSLDETDTLGLARLALAADVQAILLGAADPPGADERAALPELVALAVAVARRRPELQIILAGSVAEQAGAFRAEGPGEPSRARTAGDALDAGAVAPDSPATAPAATSGDASELILGPDATAGQPEGAALRALLEALRVRPDDARLGIARATASLAFLLERSVETFEVGLDGALRCRARPSGEAHGRVQTEWIVAADAALAPPEPDEHAIDGVLAWSTVPLDRYRLADRLRELRLAPWSDAAGEGALLRVAAARASLQRLIDASPDLGGGPAPDLTIASGGAWAAAPPPVVALALADLVRRPGATQLALDHARLLGPIGTIEDEDERRALLLDLLEDLLAPLGSLILPAGLRAGRSAGRLLVHGDSGTTELDLVPGGLELVDLPPGQAATAELDFRDTVRLGTRGRHFATRVSGGLGGLLVDLRDVPLRLPDRPERRRELLDAWQSALWTGLEA